MPPFPPLPVFEVEERVLFTPELSPDGDDVDYDPSDPQDPNGAVKERRGDLGIHCKAKSGVFLQEDLTY